MTDDLSPAETARLYDELADQVDNDPDTTYTADDLYASTERLRASLDRKLDAADIIRNRPTRSRIAAETPRRPRRIARIWPANWIVRTR